MASDNHAAELARRLAAVIREHAETSRRLAQECPAIVKNEEHAAGYLEGLASAARILDAAAKQEGGPLRIVK